MDIESKAYAPLFERYGSIHNDAEIRIRDTFYRPDKLRSFDSVKSEDRSAERMIKQCEELIKQLTAYRQDLVARYNELATMTSEYRVNLERNREYGGKITYEVVLWKIYEDGTEVSTTLKSFTGKERHKAIAYFEQYKRDHAGIKSLKNIEKHQWER